MSSESDHPRQRTVAELLAEHGDAAPTGRRARRRAAEDAAGGVTAAPRPAPTAVRGYDPADREANGRAGGQANGNTPITVLSSAGARTVDPRPGAQARGTSATGTPAGGTAATGTPTRGTPAAGTSAMGTAQGRGPGSAPAAADSVEATYRMAATGRTGDEVGPDGGRSVPPRATGTPPSVATQAGGRTSWRPGWTDGRPAPASTADVAPVAHPDSDAPFVNGGAVYADTETVAYRPSAWASPDLAGRPAPDDTRGRPTEHLPRLRADRTTMLDPGRTGPIAVQLPVADPDGGSSTAVGRAPAGIEDWHRERTARRVPGPGGDAGPVVGSPRARDDGPPTEVTGGVDDEQAGVADPPAARRRTAPEIGASGTGQAWAAVVAQWIAGAIGGAALWVGFRFLWRDLPVVAVAAAALVTVGLVLVVRALMHNDDRRTTLFAVLVGLLLTVSPALLVLLGR